MKHDIEDIASSAVAERGGRKSAPSPREADQREMQRKLEAAATPGPAHRALDALTGEWKAEVKCWQDPAGKPEVTQGSAKTRWILNGHYIEEEFRGEMMGKPFTGRTILGFDNIKQAYQFVWISDTQTAMFVSEGKGDGANKVITLHGKADCAATDQRNIPMKSVYRILGPDKHTFEMFDESKGARMMEITYSRA